MPETIFRLVGAEGYVLGCMLRNGPFFSTWRGCFGGLILSLQRMRMGMISLLTRQQMGLFQGRYRTPNHLNAVFPPLCPFWVVEMVY